LIEIPTCGTCEVILALWPDLLQVIYVINQLGWPAMVLACAAAFLVAGVAALGVNANRPSSLKPRRASHY